MAWMIHNGAFRNSMNKNIQNGCLVGFAESKQSAADISSVCYCYRPEYTDEDRHKYNSQWVIVDSNVPYLEIGYAEFSLNGEKFYFDDFPNGFHTGDQGNYIFKANGNYAYIVSANGLPYFLEREDKMNIGMGAWRFTLSDLNLLSDWSSANISAQDLLISCDPFGAYATSESLSDLHPNVKIHYDFSYRLPNSGYHDDFPTLSGMYPDGIYCECFTDNHIVHKVGDRIYLGTLSGSYVYLWQGGLTDSDGRPVYYVGQYMEAGGRLLFPELNPQPGQVWPITWDGSANAWTCYFSSQTYIRVTGTGDNLTLSYTYMNAQKWSVSVSYYRRGIPINYRFDILTKHIDDPNNIFLKGDQFVVDF